MATKDVAIATITIYRADEMAPADRIEIAAWLRRQARALVQDGENYSTRFTARYLYPHEKG